MHPETRKLTQKTCPI